MEKRKDFLVGIINPREVFGISALIEPYYYTAMSHVNKPGSVLQVDGPQLRTLCEADHEMYIILLERIASTTLQRLKDTRVQLAI
jgi:hypothetical protein